MADSDHSRNGIVGGRKTDHYRFTVLADGIIRMEWAPDCVFEDRPSSFAAYRDNAIIPPFEVKETDTRLDIITQRLHLSYNKKSFSSHGLYALIFGFTRSLWRFKEVGQPNLGGTYRTLDCIDGKTHIDDGYDIELEPGILSPKGYALLDDSKSMLFDSQTDFVAARRPSADGDRLDFYLFGYGHDYREAIKAMYTISGPPPTLPRWALGNWWSRYYDYSAESYLELMDRFQGERIPLSVAVLDMDWHLNETDKNVIQAGQTGWTGYTWNPELFPDPPAFTDELHKRNLKVSLNDHPADGIHSYEEKYQEMAQRLGFDSSGGKPIPFDCVDKEYLHAYLDIIIKGLEKDGCDFIWMDWQQGPFSWLQDVDPLWVLNHYHMAQNAKIHKHPLIFSRYAGPGSHRYPVGFSGDTVISWASLAFQPEFTATASNIGYGWWSHDIGGHMLGERDDELTVRWTQFGALSPILRLHSTKNRWITKEPWRINGAPGRILQDTLRFRHRLIPYLQTMNVHASMGEPLIQPMYWKHPDKPQAYAFKNQYFFGSQIMVAPITEPQDPKLQMARVKAWLPPGKFVDFQTGIVYHGDQTIWLSRAMANYPILLPEGAIVPLDASTMPSNGARNPAGFEVVLVIGADGAFDIIEDPDDEDGNRESRTPKGKWNRIPIRYNHKKGRLVIGPMEEATEAVDLGAYRSWSVRLLAAEPLESVQFSIDSSTLPPATISNTDTAQLISIGKVPVSATLEIHLAAAGARPPRLRRNEPVRLIEPVLAEAQISYDVKDMIWDVLEKKPLSPSSMYSRLQSVEMDDGLRAFLSECLLADNSGLDL